MIRGIGIDSVDIQRFAHWYTFTQQQLTRIFSIQEIVHCLHIPKKSAERFAARFAVREATYKALSPLCNQKIPFLTFCKQVHIVQSNYYPQLMINWEWLKKNQIIHNNAHYVTHISVTHTRKIATAFVIIEQP